MISQNNLHETLDITSTGTFSSTKEESPNVILIVLDTVRSDYLSESNLKDFQIFAKDAVRFENCIAPSPWTVPSHASLFTGLYPIEHGKHKYLEKGGHWQRLSNKSTTLAKALKNNGYTTMAIASNSLVFRSWGWFFKRGFQTYDITKGTGFYSSYNVITPVMLQFCYLTNIKPEYTLHYRPAEIINKKIFISLDKLSQSPFFLFINYMDAHEPFRPPRSYSAYMFPSLSIIKSGICRMLNIADDERLQSSFKRKQYAGEISYLTKQVGLLFSYLREKGLYDDSIIILTSDHGELLGEHNFILTLKSPCMMKL